MVRVFLILYFACLFTAAGLAIFTLFRPSTPGVPLHDSVWVIAMFIAGATLIFSLIIIRLTHLPPTPEYRRK